MIRVYKYPLMITDIQRLRAHGDFEPLSIQVQHGQPTLWAKVNTGSPPDEFVLLTFPTGEDLPTRGLGKYLGTYQLNSGLVFHVFLADEDYFL